MNSLTMLIIMWLIHDEIMEMSLAISYNLRLFSQFSDNTNLIIIILRESQHVMIICLSYLHITQLIGYQNIKIRQPENHDFPELIATVLDLQSYVQIFEKWSQCLT